MKLSACINLGWTCASCHKYPRAQTVPRCAHSLRAVPAAEPTWHHSPAGALCAASRSNSNLPGGRDKALAALKEQPYLPAPQGYLCPPVPHRRDSVARLYPQLQRNGCRWCSWPQPKLGLEKGPLLPVSCQGSLALCHLLSQLSPQNILVRNTSVSSPSQDLIRSAASGPH